MIIPHSRVLRASRLAEPKFAEKMRLAIKVAQLRSRILAVMALVVIASVAYVG